MAKCLLLVRHAAIGPQYAGRYVGVTDLPAAAGALGDLGRLAAVVAAYKPRHCLVSPLQRSRQTAAALLARLDDKPTMEIDADLREVDFGRWEGRGFDEIVADSLDEVGQWAALAPDFAFPAGERLGDFFARAGQAAERLVNRPEETVLVVTHGGVIRAMLCHLLGLLPEKHLLFAVRLASLTVLDVFSEGCVLTGLNLPAAADYKE